MEAINQPSNLLQDIISRDPQKIWATSGAIIHLRDPAALDFLAAHVSDMRAATQGVDLGGALFPNKEHLNFALRKLEFWRARTGCLCRLYPEYLMYNPKREEKDGNVRVLETKYMEGGWVDIYICYCTVCGTRLHVEEREYHYSWWAWKIISDDSSGLS